MPSVDQEEFDREYAVLAEMLDALNEGRLLPLPAGWTQPEQGRWAFSNDKGRGEIFVEYIGGSPSVWHWARVWVGAEPVRDVPGLAYGAFGGLCSAMTAVEEALR